MTARKNAQSNAVERSGRRVHTAINRHHRTGHEPRARRDHEGGQSTNVTWIAKAF
jgi:hypothetical protein